MIAAQVVSAQTFSLLFYQLHSPWWVGWVVFGLSNSLVVVFAFLGPVIYKNEARGMSGVMFSSPPTLVLSCRTGRWYLWILVLDHLWI